MPHVNDSKLLAMVTEVESVIGTVPTRDVDDIENLWLIIKLGLPLNTKSSTGDLWYQYMESSPSVVSAHINDMFYQFLAAGYEGALSDMWQSFWGSRITPNGLVSVVDILNPPFDFGSPLLTNYAGDQYLDGVNIGANPAVSNEGLWIGPAYTNEILSGYEDFTLWEATADGTGVIPIVTSGREAPDSTNSAYRLQLDSGADGTSQIFTDTGQGSTENFSVYMRSNTGDVDVTLFASNAVKKVTVTSEWHRYEYANNTTVNGNIRIAKAIGWGTSGVADLDIWHPQANRIPYLFPYIPPAATSTSAAATSGGNGASIEMDDNVLGALRGLPDGVELITNGDFSSGSASWQQTAPAFTFENGTCSTDNYGSLQTIYQDISAGADDRYRVTFTIDAITQGTVYVALSGAIGTARSSPGTYSEIIVAAGSSVNGGIQFSSSAIATIDNVSVQELLPATCTALSEMFIGVGSAELPTGVETSINNVSVVDDIEFLRNYRLSSGAARLVGSYDGTTFVLVAGDWNRNEVHKRVVTTGTSGTVFRVGYRRFESDGITPITDWVWSGLSAFDGSFDPLDFLRFGYLNTTPMWLRNSYIWTRGNVAEAELDNPWGVTV